jgi:hypothetical protein
MVAGRTGRSSAVETMGQDLERAGGPADGGGRSLVVQAWWDPDLALRGFDPRSAYVERFWLPLIGPSTLLLLRRFARGLELRPAGFRVSLAETARALGLGAGTGRQAPINRTVDRACTYGLARRSGPDTLLVRTHLPPLTRRQVDRLPPLLQRSHHEARTRTGPRPLRREPPPGPAAA